MKLARREMLWPVVYGALLGALAGSFVSELGLVTERFRGAPLALTLAVVGSGLAVANAIRVLAAVDGLLFLVYLVVAFTPLTDALAERWVRSDTVTHADAVIVLSGGLASNGSLDLTALDRLLAGLALMRQGDAPRLVTTRVVDRIAGERVTSDDDQRRTVSLVGPLEWDVVAPVSITRDEAVRSAALLLPSGAKHVLVVTSPMHTRRACAVFSKAGFDVVCVPAFEHEYPTWHPKIARERLASFRAYFYERMATMKYRWAGWI